MDIKTKDIQIKINKTKNSIPIPPKKNQIKSTGLNTDKNMNNLEAKNYNNFIGVFGVHPENAKYMKKKKEETKIIDCKTPEKKDENENIKKNKKRNSVTPFKIKNFLFNINKETQKKEIKDTANEKNQINNIKTEKMENKINKDIKDDKNIEKDKKLKKEKTQAEIINKRPILKRASRIYELNFYEPYNEKIIILDGEGNTYEADFERKNFEIKISFNENIFNSFNDINFTSNYFTFPQYSIYKVKYNPDSKNTTIILKDFRSFKIQTKDDDFSKKINFVPKERVDFFKYSYLFIANQLKKVNYPINGWEIYDPIKEYERQGVPYGMDSFRLSQINLKYKLCDTYPNYLFLPSQFDDSSLAKIASCRVKNRFPVLTYIYTHPENDNDNQSNNIINNQNKNKNDNQNASKKKKQTFLYRSSQINTGFIFNKKVNYEIEYINAINNIGFNNEFIFYDCRPYLNAKANSLKGAGIDDTTQYKNCKGLFFGCIENIHAVRKSLKKAVEKTNYGNSSINSGKLAINSNNNIKKFLSKFEETKWLDYLSDLLCGANYVAKNILSKVNVICHCSDGWDRTSQICSLVQIILDPYFRTFKGFAVLIEKDWVSFGHQFAIRNGCDCRSEKKKERSPIFVQFLHAIYQMMAQYPNAFEFRENMLLFLSEEIYSNKYGTFLFNSEKELEENEAKKITVSIWSEIFLNKKKFQNPFYKYIKEPLIIKGEVQYLIIWKEFFYKYIKIGVVKEEGENDINSINNLENMLYKQKNSIIELMNIIKKNGLEKKMKNNEFYKIYKDYLDS